MVKRVKSKIKLLFFKRLINLYYNNIYLYLYNFTFILFSVCVYIFAILILIVFFGDLVGIYMESKTLSFFKMGNYREASSPFVNINFVVIQVHFNLYDFKFCIS